ncbi:Thiol-disulfide oxidoreductase ResA [compost metagenome]
MRSVILECSSINVFVVVICNKTRKQGTISSVGKSFALRWDLQKDFNIKEVTNMNRNRWILVGVIVCLAVVLYENSGQSILSRFSDKTKNSSPSEQTLSNLIAENTPKPGTPSPAFSLTGLDGHNYEVGGKRDKPLLLNFWASWCDPCKEEAPDLVNLYKKYGDKMDVYGVNVTAYDKLENAKKFVEEYHYTFPILLDEKEEVYRMFNGIAFPTNALIDKNGVIQEVIIGILPPEELEAKVKKLLEDS